MLKRMLGIGVAILAPSVLLTGCLAGKSMPQEHYLLQAKAGSKICFNKAMNSISVMPFAVMPPFTTEQFVYRLNNIQWQVDYYHTFMSSIDQQFIQLTTNALQTSHCWSDVGNVWQPIVNPSYRLNGSVKEIYADYRDRQHPMAVLVVDYKITDAQTNQLIWKHSYQKNILLKEKSTEALVSAWGQAATQITQQLAFDIKKISLRKVTIASESKADDIRNTSSKSMPTLKNNLLKQLQASHS